jgi:hypothetical protein
MTSKGLIMINFKYMRKLIEKIKAKFSRKPLLVIPDVSVQLFCPTCNSHDIESSNFNHLDYIKGYAYVETFHFCNGCNHNWTK